MYKIKLHKTSKCLWRVYIDMFVVKWNVFFKVFINHFLKIHRSVLRKITIDLLYFLNVYDVNLWKENFGRSMACSCRTNDFKGKNHFKEKKRDSNTGVFLWNLWNFPEQWWLLLKTRNILLRNKTLCSA